MLTLYRRHTNTCSKGHPVNHRMFKPNGSRQRNADCHCPINVSGRLGSTVIKNRTTHQTGWAQAEALAHTWETQGSIERSKEEAEVTVEYAVSSFLASQGPQGRNVEPNTFYGFTVLLRQRLLTYAAFKGYRMMSSFDDLDTMTKFVESWRNLTTFEPLADSTKKTEIERLRAFLEYCLDRQWIKNNYAKKLKFSFKTEPKFGMSPDEEAALFNAIDESDLKAFCLLMRWAGLRISDATMFNDLQLVQRASGVGWAVRIERMKKTGDSVYVPIPDHVAQTLLSHGFMGRDSKKRYWFWTGHSEPEAAIQYWRGRIMRVVNRLTFLHPVTPHTFRHTFAISYLNAGADIKVVSRWLGHSSVLVTEKHYAHAIHGTHVASDMAFEAVTRQLTMK